MKFPRYLISQVHFLNLFNRQLSLLIQELVSFLDGSGDAGFIIVSFGSMLRGDGLPKNFRRLFLSVFARLTQRVVWKWEDQSKLGEREGLIPSNVKTISWLPQKELLSHRNARLFISHGGLLSKQETVFHGVPAIFLPIFADQPINAQKAEDDGYAIRLDLGKLTEEILYNSIQAILTNPRYYNFLGRDSRIQRIISITFLYRYPCLSVMKVC
jgi:glucuronosyltransferase